MTNDLSTVYDEARDAANSGLDSFFSKVAGRLGAHATADAVFGDPVERDGVTVIPVGKVRWGFGGGMGKDASDSTSGAAADEGMGGGGGIMASPLGFIEISAGMATFRRINDPTALWPLLLSGAVATWIVFRAFRGLFR